MPSVSENTVSIFKEKIMSHFTVAVFTDDNGASVRNLLAPYSEEIEVEPYVLYTKDEIIRIQKERIESNMDTYREYLSDPEAFLNKYNCGMLSYYKDTFPKLLEMTDDELHADYFAGYDGRIGENGEYISTYNPDSKWDWYSIGGRWAGELALKPEYDEDGYEWSDEAPVRAIDFERMQKKKLEDLQPYEEARKNTYYKDEYWISRYPSEDEYVRSMTEFSTFAVITPDGEWHEPGTMGWFACSTATPDDELRWEKEYYERFLKPAIDNDWTITMVDCHI